MLTGVVAVDCSSREELTTTSGKVIAAALRRSSIITESPGMMLTAWRTGWNPSARASIT
jgi:hypothetical protein